MRNIFFLLSFFTGFISFSQSISPFVFSSSGNHFSGGNHQLSWTIGEPVISTLSVGNSVLTQGFHQTYNPVFTSIESENTSSIISIFPNPASESIKILFPKSGFYVVSLTDLIGREILSRRINNETSFLVDIACFSTGHYYVRIINSDQQLLSITKFFKQ